ncbi:diglucosylglycerate octanoyltransferase [Nocardia rosealba]|uniref:diglucosylglycerate octanoyltransferase n=1 Tax=Nocardia rosealba TaxID=2878563 RepID=UPI001CD99BA2|nr:diglucosylglycerate octanoyltransferase [Nocardia rosealba]MCA2208941.1 GDSL-type esterase/lipase family protein [Nocardia rosealba]
MSSEEPVRSVPDELFQQVTAKPGRQLPDALFGPPPARPARPEREEPIRSVPDELFKQVTARSTRSLPDALFGPPPSPVAEPETDSSADDESGSGAHDSGEESSDDEGSVAAKVVDDVGNAVGAGSADGTDALTEGSDSSAAQVDTGTPVTSASGTDSVSRAQDDSNTTVDTQTVDRADSTLPRAGESVAAEAESRPRQTETAQPQASTSTVAQVEATPAQDGASGIAHAESVSARADTAAEALLGAETAESGSTAEGEPGVQSQALLAPSPVQPADGVSAMPSVLAEPSVPQNQSISTVDAEAPAVRQEVSTEVVEQASPRPVLLVIADSLAYFGPKGGLPADDPRIWPNLVAAELDWDVELVARIGWTCRDAYWALIGDPRVWAAVPRAGAVVFAVGGMDTLPSPLPTALRETIRYIRPPRLRRGVRATYNWLQPKLSKLGRPVALPPRVSVDYLEQSREALTQLRPELPVVAVLPSVHRCDAYGRVHRGRPRAVKALRAWSARTSVPLVDLGEAVRDDIESGSANPDGIHWGWAGHQAVATAMTKALQEVR